MKVKVYKVKNYNILTDQCELSQRMATREGAKTMGGQVVEDSEMEIEESELKPGEQWTPIGFKPQP